MSCGSLYVIDNNSNGIKFIDFNNNIYFTDRIINYLLKRFYIDKNNNCFWFDDLKYRIFKLNDFKYIVLLHIISEQIFDTKQSKTFLLNILNDLLIELNEEYPKQNNCMENTIKNINETFHIVLDAINNLDENVYPYFIFQNSNVSNCVDNFFRKYDKEKDDMIKIKFFEREENKNLGVCFIKDKQIVKSDKIFNF